MMAEGSRRLLLASALAAAACGRLSVPDLSTGTVEGRLLGAAPAGAYVYVRGAPDRIARVAADGSFALERTPVGTQRLILFDGVSRAEISGPVEVRGGMRSRLADRDAGAMPLAGRIVAAARPSGGALPEGVRFTVEGTIHRDLVAGLLGPLPAGSWSLTVKMGGFRPRQIPVAVQAGLAADAELLLDIDDGDERRGCLSSSCPSGLHCASDGRCYACTRSEECGADDVCDPVTHTCVEGTADGDLCESVTAPGQCASGRMAPALPYSYCSVGCAASPECPAGWSCDLADGLCKVNLTCRDVRATFGSPCLRDDTCAAALAGGFCLRREEDAGFCTAPCAADASCAAAGYGTCRPSPGGRPDSCQR